MKKRSPFIYISIQLLGLSLFVSLESCSSYRTSDKKNISFFENQGLEAQIHYENKDGKQIRHLHSKPYDSLLPSLYFVHGAPGSSDNFINFLSDSTLNAKANLISIDRLGYGYSEFGIAHTSFDEQAKYLSPILEKYSSELQPGLLVGWSYAAPIAIKMAMNHPKRTMGVVLLGASLDPESIRYYGPSGLAKFKLTQWLVSKTLRVANTEKRYQAENLDSLSEQWTDLKIPLIMIHGTSDKIAPFLDNTRFAKRNMMGNSLSIIPFKGVGNLFPIFEMEKTKELLVSQLDSLKQFH
jgi:pimeloyl-ACP methyl ester carboxylesterase